MGNDLGKGSRMMAVTAMANTTHFDKQEIKALHKKFAATAALTEPKHLLNRIDFEAALKAIGIVEKDQIILGHLFTLFDATGDELINFKEFCTALSVLVKGSLEVCHAMFNIRRSIPFLISLMHRRIFLMICFH